MSIILIIKYKREKSREMLGYIGFFVTLLIGQFISSFLYKVLIPRKPMTIIQTLIPIIAVSFIFIFSKKPKK